MIKANTACIGFYFFSWQSLAGRAYPFIKQGKIYMKMYQVDAFTQQLFKGNPAAVIVLQDWLDDTLMQNIAL